MWYLYSRKKLPKYVSHVELGFNYVIQPSRKKMLKQRWKPHGLWYSVRDEWLTFKAYNMEPRDIGLSVDHIRIKNGKLARIIIKRNGRTNIRTEHRAKILTIASIRDLMTFSTRYGGRDHQFMVNWDKVADKYAGIEFKNVMEITKILHRSGDSITVSHPLFWFLMIDVNSGCIWRPSPYVTIKKIDTTDDSVTKS